MTQLKSLAIEIGSFLENPAILRMKDFQFGWYMRLLFHLARSGGYLPLDCNLGTLAGAHSGQYWDANAGPVLACFKVQERDGRKYIFSNSVLRQISTPNCGNGKRERVTSDITLSETLNPIFEKAWGKYTVHVAKKVARKSFLSAVQRISKSNRISVEEAGEYIAHMAEVYASSPAGQRGRFTPHMSTWLNQERFADDPAEWSRTEEKPANERARKNSQVIAEVFADELGADDARRDAEALVG